MAVRETYPIKGVPLPDPNQPPNSPVPLRREVNEWFRSKVDNDVIQVKLFLLALIHFEGMDVESQLSYFQVAGIHGYPQKDWDGVPKPKMVEKQANLQGYCTHNSILFPSFHRPYMMLYEQRLYEIMVENIIVEHTAGASPETKTAWQEAAKSWRLPFWDWAASTRVPDIARDERIMIDTPAFPSTQYRNPVFKFSMPRGDKMGDHGVPRVWGGDDIGWVPYQDCVGTSRWPRATAGSGWVDGDVNNEKVDEALEKAAWPQKGMPALTIADAVYRLFTHDWFMKYEAFATTHYYKITKDPEVTHYLSLEGIHNMIHNWTGGVTLEGHMSEVPVAAFDPIFWLHHANIDRFYAIWQDLHKSLWWDDTSPLKEDGLPDTFLKPFHDNKVGGEWNSDKARWCRESCGYSYPELQPWLPRYQKNGKFDETLYRLDIKFKINDLYGTMPALALKPPKGVAFQSPIHDNARVMNDYVVFASYEKYDEPQQRWRDPKLTFFRRFALGGAPFTIHILLGPELSARTEPAVYSNEIGIIYNFSSALHTGNGSAGCANCAAQAADGALATGLLPLTSALIYLSAAQDGLNIDDREKTLDWLKVNLSWKVTSVGGREVDLSSLPSLTVGVAGGTGVHSSEDGRLSEFSGYEVYRDVTDGQDGGLQRGQHL